MGVEPLPAVRAHLAQNADRGRGLARHGLGVDAVGRFLHQVAPPIETGHLLKEIDI